MLKFTNVFLTTLTFLFSAYFFIEVKSVLAAPPSGFTNSVLVNAGLSAPTGFEIAPDGRIFILEQAGKIKIFKNGQLLPQVVEEFEVATEAERGLLGIAFDPEFNINHVVYVYYVDKNDLEHKVAKFVANTDVSTTQPEVIYSSGYKAGEIHIGGTIQFGLDQKLYISIGDNGYNVNSQNLSNSAGKILRINKDGTIPSDNPFVNNPNAKPEIWAYGLRNPFRFQFDKATGALYVGDVGQAEWEEVNKVVKGGNYGWPNAEGDCQVNCSGFINPIYKYFHDDNRSFSITGGAIYNGSSFPSSYKGKLFFGDYAQGFLKTLTLDSNGNQIGVNDFDLAVGSIVDMKVGSDGALYYITIFPGKLFKIVYDNGNKYPVATAGANVNQGLNPLTIQFSSVGSGDPEGASLTYQWDFGDGTNSTAPNPVKTYQNKGVYAVQLRVSDGVNTTLSNTLTINVGKPPTLTVLAPLKGALYKAGDVISYNASATDSNGASLSDSAFTREVLFHHGTHVHPFVRQSISKSGTFTIPTTGETAPDVWYEIVMRATDSSGLSTSTSVNIYPRKATLNFVTEPAGMQVTVNGIPHTTPKNMEAVVGIKFELDAPSQEVNGILYEFDRWSDTGSKKHVISVPETSTTYTAMFRKSQPFAAEYFNNVSLTGAPALQRNDPFIDFTWNEGSPSQNIQNDNFSARWKKQQYFSYGRYKFTASVDDGVHLFVDGNLVIDKWTSQAVTDYSATIDLAEGLHEIKMEYYEGNGGAIARLVWAMTPDQPAPAYPDFKGEYFDNKTLLGTPKLVRNDTSINFVWNEASPASAIPADQFSVRWTKTQPFEQSNYRFKVTADDGVRLYIDGEKIIDQWKDQMSTEYIVEKNMTAGPHEIKVEYYENFGGAAVKFFLEKVSESPVEGAYNAQYWNIPAQAAPPLIPTSAPIYTNAYQAIDFNWQDGSPHQSINLDNFVAVWRKSHMFSSGKYRFITHSDDGIRVYIDSNLILDEWNDHEARMSVIDVDISAGLHEIRIEYYERKGEALAQLNFQKVTASMPSFSGEYFDTIDLSGTPIFTRLDPAVAFYWGENSAPNVNVPKDLFSARWQKTQSYTEGERVFTVTADDGVRLYIDNELVLDKWIDQPPTVYTVRKALSAGSHSIKMEYYERSGAATVALEEN